MSDVVRIELTVFRSVLESVIGEGDDKIRQGYVRTMLKTITGLREYKEMSVDTRIKIFDRKILTKVEEAYHTREIFLQQIELLYDGYFKLDATNKVNYEQIKNISEGAMSVIDDGLNAIPEEWTKYRRSLHTE